MQLQFQFIGCQISLFSLWSFRIGINSDTKCYDLNEKSVINIKKFLFESNGICLFALGKVTKLHLLDLLLSPLQSIYIELH